MQWETIVVGILGAASTAYFAFRKQDVSDFESIKKAYREMLTELKEQVHELVGKVDKLESQQIENVGKIRELAYKEDECQKRVAHVISQNNQLLEILGRAEKGN